MAMSMVAFGADSFVRLPCPCSSDGDVRFLRDSNVLWLSPDDCVGDVLRQDGLASHELGHLAECCGVGLG